MSDEKNRPIDVLRDGNLKASIWENARDGQTSHSVQFRRSYRDQDGQVRDADSFFGADLLRLSRLAEQSYDRVGRLRKESRQAQPPRRTRARDEDRGR